MTVPRRKRGRASWTAPPTYVELRTLEPGQRFMFWATDLARRGPCVLVEKSGGRAMIRYEGTTTRTFTARDAHGQLVERTITEAGGVEPCSLGAQVVALV